MGSWAKKHTNDWKEPNPHKRLQGRWDALKDDITPDMPGESPEEKALRDRQAMEIARLDEEENRKIKSMFSASGGRKLFRGQRTGKAPAKTAGGTSGAPATGAGSSYGGRPTRGGGGSSHRSLMN